jgi:hypothetical protein
VLDGQAVASGRELYRRALLRGRTVPAVMIDDGAPVDPQARAVIGCETESVGKAAVAGSGTLAGRKLAGDVEVARDGRQKRGGYGREVGMNDIDRGSWLIEVWGLALGERGDVANVGRGIELVDAEGHALLELGRRRLSRCEGSRAEEPGGRGEGCGPGGVRKHWDSLAEGGITPRLGRCAQRGSSRVAWGVMETPPQMATGPITTVEILVVDSPVTGPR